MTTLREAAQQALEALEGGADSWQRVGPAIDALKEALVEDACCCGEPTAAGVVHRRNGPCYMAEPVQDGCDHCNHPLYAAIKCKVCGRDT